ncbi:MAG: hypothetical protein HYU05_02100 [Candidatus Wildermuthbacteria bacterium]|nr:hypothetical protein [Candidatus Wildermuthbacteria bacterium]
MNPVSFSFAQSVSLLYQLAGFVFDLIISWWWIFLPLVLWKYFKFHWIWWRNELFDARTPRMVIELLFPPDVEKPLKAMESVFAGFWRFHNPPNLREKWIDGEYQGSFAIEIVSTEGAIHFYMRFPAAMRKLVETSIHSQYPEVEVVPVEDYTKLIPRNIPNKEWELWGCNYKLKKPSPYPIRTYSEFFEESPDSKEEKRVDPMAQLFEGLSKIGKGEHIWMQFGLKPILPEDMGYGEKANEIISKIAKRPMPKAPGGFFDDLKTVLHELFGGFVADAVKVGSVLATGREIEFKTAVQKEKEEMFPGEMRMTPGERDIVAAVERKVSKQSFRVMTRFIYVVSRRDALHISCEARELFRRFKKHSHEFLRPIQHQ